MAESRRACEILKFRQKLFTKKNNAESVRISLEAGVQQRKNRGKVTF